MSHPFPGWIPIHDSGLFLVRAMTTQTNTLRFASTGPFYVELGGGKHVPQQNESAQFFIEWCEERMANLRNITELNPEQKEEVLQPWRKALAFWQSKKNRAPTLQTVRAEVVDAETHQPIPARVYVKNETGGWHFVQTSTREGSAVRYEKQNWFKADSEEFHTTVSAHPFEAKLPPGRYEWVIEHGKEYFPFTQIVEVSD